MGESQPPEERRGRRGFWSFWATLPGVLTGVAALLTAVVGIVAAWKSLTKGDEAARSVPRDDRSAVSTIAQPTTVASPGVGDMPAGVLARGQVTMKDLDYADFERGLVGNPSNADLVLKGADELIASYGAAPTPGPADKEKCIAALNARRDGVIQISTIDPGMWLCIQTEEGHVAAMEIVKAPGVGNPQLVLGYTVWR